ncbi:MAG: glycoside hydrolase family 15 protein [Proteobacteria bacterium]|nr:glycoside hydrolase family 15 protein [Pseudomonadota bacterium]
MAPAEPRNLDLAVIGNCAFAALIDRKATVVWACLPRFDGNPVFCSLLNGADGNGAPEAPAEGEAAIGFFAIDLDGFARSEQHYLRNTAILVTTLYDGSGSAVEVTDFAPRLKHYGRPFRPTTMVRQIRPVIGTPRVRIRLRPAQNYGAQPMATTRGSNHIRYVGADPILRLTTDAPVTFILDETPFLLEDSFTMILGPDEILTRPVEDTGRQFYENTHDYWQEWVRYLSLPFEWQEVVIRAAITLKLSAFEETGAIVAAMTTSIPEAPGSGRNWDYRYCWLRDAYFVVHALNRLGATRTMEEHLRYINNIVVSSADGRLQPVYGVGQETRLVEREVPTLKGFRGIGPVRVGNQAYEHVQNDVYGSVILAATQSFFDQRLKRPGTIRLFERLERVGEQAILFHDRPDAGLWEFRTRARVHTFSALMCWAGCDRLAKIGERLGLSSRAAYWRGAANRIARAIHAKAWNEAMGSFVDSFGGEAVDASLLLMRELGFVAPQDPRFLGTLAAVEKTLKRGKHLFRYAVADDFGVPKTAFNICTFWYINALAAVGRREEARDLFENMLASRNAVGLLSEDIDPETGALWGNFPQTYSMVGLITSAMNLSRAWEEAL